MVVVSIDNRSQSEELFEKISQIENVKKMSNEQMQQCMNNNFDNIRKVRKKKNLKEKKISLVGFVFSIISERQVIKNKLLIEIQLVKLLLKWLLQKISDFTFVLSLK
jgi:hypothetical protein